MNLPPKAGHLKTGRDGELLAVKYLVEHSYEIIERNWRSRHLEIDIIATKNSTLFFFEVKTRTTDTYGQPIEAVVGKKMKNFKTAGAAYSELHEEHKRVQYNVISILIYPNQKTEISLFEDV